MRRENLSDFLSQVILLGGSNNKEYTLFPVLPFGRVVLLEKFVHTSKTAEHSRRGGPTVIWDQSLAGLGK